MLLKEKLKTIYPASLFHQRQKYVYMRTESYILLVLWPVQIISNQIKSNEKTAQRDANTARWRSQKNCPAADPLPGVAGRPKFNQLEMVTTFTYKPSLVRIDARNFDLSW